MGSIRTDVVSTKRKSLYCQFLTKGLRPPSGIPFIHRSGGGGRGRKMTCQEFSSAIGGLRTETDVAGRRSCPAARAGAEPGREPGLLLGSIRRYFPIVVTPKNIPVTAPLYAYTADRQRAGWAGSPGRIRRTLNGALEAAVLLPKRLGIVGARARADAVAPTDQPTPPASVPR